MTDSVANFLQVRHRHQRVQRAAAAFVRACAVLSMLLGAMALAGWGLDLPGLKSVLPGAVEMKSNTALALLLSGLALLLVTSSAGPVQARHRLAAQALGVAVAAIGLATTAQYLLGWDLGIDEALVRDVGAHSTATPGRMSSYSAAAFAFLGIGHVCLPTRRWRGWAMAFGGATALLGLLSLMGYLWGASELVSDHWVPPMAVHTVAAFFLLGLGTLVAAIRFPQGGRRMRLLLDTIELRILASFVGALLALIALGGLVYGAAADYAHHSGRLAQIREFRGQLAEFYADAADAAFAQRNYLVTGEPAHAERWRAGLRQLADSRNGLREDARRLGSAERASFNALDQAVAELTELLETGVQLYRGQGADAARAFVLTQRCTAAMAKVRSALMQLDRVESGDEQKHDAMVQRDWRDTIVVSIATMLAVALVLAGVFLAIRREMAARVKAERALRRRTADATAATRFLESVIHNIPHMIFVKEAQELRFVRLNRAGEELTGLAHREVVGKTDRDLFPPGEAEFFVARDREVLERGEVLDIPEEELHTAGRGVRLLHTRKIPLIDASGRPTHLLGISEDVTEAREKERQIHRLNEALQARAEDVERVNSAKSIFLATMSHEIRTPMNGMLGMLELLSLSPLDEKQRQTLDTVSESGQSLLRIIDDILDFSKIEADKLELREEVASVAAIVRDVSNIHSPLASSKGLVITTAADAALSPAVWVDPIRLRQVLNNFVSNAVKFTARGQVAIRANVLATLEDRQSLRFSVADTGAGIAPQDQKSLFTPFVQVGQAGNRMAGGTGLGLVISRRLVELMGGTLDLESEVGRGTTLSFTLSVRTAPAALLPQPEQRRAALRQATARMRQPPDAARAQAEGTLVLVVDDHPVNRALLEQQLATLGYAAQTARDGEDALRQWESGRFGLVLTDCQMPAMDGYELARRIRRHEAAAGLRRMPVIACTAMALEGEVRKCLDAGMDDCLIKPVQLMEMLQTLERWLPLPAGRPDERAGSAPEPPALRGASAVDTTLLEQTWGSDPDTIRSILAAYGRSAWEDRAALRNAMAHRDLDAAMQVAHRMLGASRMVGALGLADACALVNVASRERDWDALVEAMEAFEDEYARLGSELRGRGVDVPSQPRDSP